jgi:hypothetical protein
MSFLEGSQVVSPPSQKNWATQWAETLARVYSINGDDIESAKFFDADSIVAPWLDSHEIPERLTSHPDGRAVWDGIQTLKNLLGKSRLVWFTPIIGWATCSGKATESQVLSTGRQRLMETLLSTWHIAAWTFG